MRMQQICVWIVVSVGSMQIVGSICDLSFQWLRFEQDTATVELSQYRFKFSGSHCCNGADLQNLSGDIAVSSALCEAEVTAFAAEKKESKDELYRNTDSSFPEVIAAMEQTYRTFQAILLCPLPSVRRR